jgi:alpha 1,3-glucosidase
MWMQYPKTESLFPVDDQYMVGSDLLVKPVTAPGIVETAVKFPTDDCWYDAETLKIVSESGTAGGIKEITVPSDINTIPVFQRGGSIIARKLRLRRSTHMMTRDPYTLYVAMDSSMKAMGSLYMDDEETFDHQTKAEYAIATITADFSGKTGTIKNTVDLGAGWASHVKDVSSGYLIERIIIIGLREAPSSVDVGSTSLGFTYDSHAKILVIRKPDMPAVDEWQMTVKP